MRDDPIARSSFMPSVYVPRGTSLERVAVEPGQSPPQNAVRIDMVTPTMQEGKLAVVPIFIFKWKKWL